MTRFLSYSFAFLGLFAMITITGCGPAGHTVQPVTGKITYKGEPVEGALVTFVSVDPYGHGAIGTTTSDGTYTLQTHAAPKPGAVVGDYDIFVAKTIAVDIHGKEYLNENQPLGPLGRPATKHLIPMKYSGDGVPSVLSATVQKGKNVFDFNLED